MQSGLTAHRSLSVRAALGCLFILACTVTAEAGITLSGGSYKGVGDPKAHYDLFAYLDPGSVLVEDNYFTLDKLFGIKNGANYKIITPDKKQKWGVEFGALSHPHLKVGGIDYGKFPATDVTFEYLGPDKIKNTSTVPLLLGEFKIFEKNNTELPALPSGTTIDITYDYKTKDSQGSNIPFSFTVVPEPSSFVIATLVGACATGVALLRRGRRAV